MKYEIDENIKKIIMQLCDVALKAGGLQNKAAVDQVLNVIMRPIKEKKEDKGDKK